MQREKVEKNVLLLLFKAHLRYKAPAWIEGISGNDMMKTKPWEELFRIPFFPLQKIHIAGAELCAVLFPESSTSFFL